MNSLGFRRVRRASLWLLVYVQVGYPVLVVAAARLRRPALPLPTGLPSVTVIIAAWDEEQAIGDKLGNTLSADYPPHLLQVVVAADGSTDRTAEVARGLGDERVVVSDHAGRDGKVAAINRSLPLASGAIVVFSDANNHYRPQTLRRLVEPFADPSVGAVSGAKLTSTGPDELKFSEGLYWRYENLIRASESRLASCTSASGEILAVRRALAEPLPLDVGLDDFVRILEVLKKGFRVAFAPEAISVEATSASVLDEKVRRTRITSQRWRLLAHPSRFPLRRPLVMWQIASHKIGRLFLPVLALVGLAANLGEVARDGRKSRGAVAALGAQLLFYTAGAVGPRLGLRGRSGRVAHLPHYLIATNAATLKGLSSALRRGDHQLWAKVERHR